jgi:hypothetical protein
MIGMIKRLFIVAFLLVLLSFTMFGRTWAQVLTPGVNMGDTFIYGVTAFWSSNDEYASIPLDLVDINQTESIEVRISNVADANVTTFVALYFKNGTADADRGLVDLDTGVSYGSFVAIIGANLNANDVVHPLGTDAITINETVIKSYESGNRETNRIIIEYTNATTGTTGRVDRYFDKATGILVESHETEIISDSDSETTTTVSWEIKESNVWVIPEFPSALILPLVMIVTMIAVIAYKKKNASITKTLAPAKTHKF